MAATLRHRKNAPGPAENKASILSDNAPTSTTSAVGGQFEGGLWILLAAENWILDFGRPWAMNLAPLEWFPLSRPSLGDYFHMAYNVLTAFVLLKLLNRADPRGIGDVGQLLVVVFVMGASIHLVGDSVNHRLIHLGYQNHVALEDNNIFKDLNPPGLLASFQLLYFYDEFLGHMMWYLPYMAVLVAYFNACLRPSRPTPPPLPLWGVVFLLPVNVFYYWYLATEGQIVPLFAATTFAMLLCWANGWRKGYVMDSNGRYLLLTFAGTLVLVGAWVAWLWDDQPLRARYPGLMYFPEPWAYYTLYLAN